MAKQILFNESTKTLNKTLMKNRRLLTLAFFSAIFSLAISFPYSLLGQTNVYDAIIANSPDHTYLKAALDQQNLDVVLKDNNATYTVFAPTNAAFDNLAAALNTNIAGLLALPNLTDVLTYHVLGASVNSSAVTNGAIVTPLNTANTIKMTKTSTNMVYANQAMVVAADLTADNGVVHSVDAVLLPYETVVDIAIDNGFTTLTQAVVTAEFLPLLTNPIAQYTVFAPTNTAFDNLAAVYGVSTSVLLNSPDLADILAYHVLDVAVNAGSITNGALVNPLNTTNTLKLTKTTNGDVFVNQAAVTSADITTQNGVVHVIDKIVLPNPTVVDVALDNGFNALAAAVIKAELLPALTDPFADLTVFAPTDAAFDSLASGLGVDLNELLNLPNLADILTYHVLAGRVTAMDINNGDIVSPLSTTNTLKLTKTTSGEVFINHAKVVTADNDDAVNGIVHVIDAVVLPIETVVDVAIDNGFTSLAAAVVKAELLPALTNPLSELTVFAPRNEDFEALASALSTDINGILNLPNLADILLYHVVPGKVLSTDLANGSVMTLNGADILVDLTNGVKINNASVVGADNTSDNGVVHIINEVLLPLPASVNEVAQAALKIFPNPATDIIYIDAVQRGTFKIQDLRGAIIEQGNLNGNSININNLTVGTYLLTVESEGGLFQSKVVKY